MEVVLIESILSSLVILKKYLFWFLFALIFNDSSQLLYIYQPM